MTERRIDVFFYGLFMDEQVLRNAGVAPRNLRRGYIDEFSLRIGQRATLVPSTGARAHGVLAALTHEELDGLYAGPGLEPYRPEAVLAHTLTGAPVAALCFNLSPAPPAAEHNPEYAARLRSVLRKLGFPPEYIEAIS